MVKAYLRYELASTFGVITSNSNIVHSPSGKQLITAALENVLCWNLKQGIQVSPCSDLSIKDPYGHLHS